MDKKRLRSKMALRSFRDKDLAALLGITPSAVSRKMSGEFSFSLEEVSKIQDWLSLSDKEVNAIFLP